MSEILSSTCRRTFSRAGRFGRLVKAAVAAAAASLALSLPSPANAATTMQDITFNYSDWALTTYRSNLGWVNAINGQFGFRVVYVALVLPLVTPGKVLGVHIYSPASNSTYDPAISGPIGAVKTSVLGHCLGSSCQSQHLQLFGSALRQAGKDYIAGDAIGYPIGTFSTPLGGRTDAHTWAANQFCLVSNTTIAGNNNISCDINQHPNFSPAGAPIQCGIFTYSDASIPDSPLPTGGIVNSTDGHQYNAVATSYDNWSCTFLAPGTLKVRKSVSPDPAGIASTTTFPITVSCIEPSGAQTSYTLTVNGNATSAPVTGLVPGGTCQPAEALPALFYNTMGEMCVWQQPTFKPATIAIASGDNSIAVINSYSCGPPPTGTLNVFKKILAGTSPLPVIFGPWGLTPPTFTITAYCGGQAQGSFNLTPPILLATMSVPYGSSCTIQEPALPSPFTDGQGNICTWQQVAPLLPTVMITGQSQSVTITNSYTCAPPVATLPSQTGSLTITKAIRDWTGAWHPQDVFPITANCGSAGTFNFTLTGDGSSHSIPNLPAGTSCTVTETPPNPGLNGLAWCPPLYPQGQTIVVAPSPTVMTATVRNRAGDCSSW